MSESNRSAIAAAYKKLEDLIPKDDITYVEVSMLLKDSKNEVVGRVSYAQHQPSMFITIFLGTFASSVIAVNVFLVILLCIGAFLRARWKNKWNQLKEWMTQRSIEVKEFVKKQKAAKKSPTAYARGGGSRPNPTRTTNNNNNTRGGDDEPAGGRPRRPI